MLLNVKRQKVTDKIWSPADFFPKEIRVEQSEEEMLLAMNQWVARTKAN